MGWRCERGVLDADSDGIPPDADPKGKGRGTVFSGGDAGVDCWGRWWCGVASAGFSKLTELRVARDASRAGVVWRLFLP